jgi:hypothetical protein
LYHLQRERYLNRNGEVDQEWAEKTWEQWEQREGDPAVEAFETYNNPPCPEMIGLESLKESLRRGDDAVNNMWAEVVRADEVLEVAAMAPKSRVSDGIPAAMREILEDMRRHLRSVEEAQRTSKQQLQLLEPAVKSLVNTPSPHTTSSHNHTNPTSPHRSNQSPTPKKPTRKDKPKTKQ